MADLDADNRSISELFEAALAGDYDDEEPRVAVRELRHRSNPETEVLKVALGYCHSGNPKTRSRGLDVLAQLGAGKPDSERPWIEECVSVAIAALQDENSQVVHSAAWALAHLGGPRSVLALIKIKQHSDPGVRWAVAYGMRSDRNEDSKLTLVELMEDPDDEVRDWATFGLGDLWRIGDSFELEDSPEIRAALRKRLADSYAPARDEALWGLAKRKEPFALRELRRRLESDGSVSGDEMAANELLNPNGGESTIEELQSGLRRLIDELPNSP
jgi:HEAT repeat protein